MYVCLQVKVLEFWIWVKEKGLVVYNKEQHFLIMQNFYHMSCNREPYHLKLMCNRPSISFWPGVSWEKYVTPRQAVMIGLLGQTHLKDSHNWMISWDINLSLLSSFLRKSHKKSKYLRFWKYQLFVLSSHRPFKRNTFIDTGKYCTVCELEFWQLLCTLHCIIVWYSV